MNKLLIFCFCLVAVQSVAQVSNDEISNRIKLSLNDKWYASSTRNANVEWDCINKKLTSTCLVYHNDQWFTITPPQTGTYFVNISNQHCANKQGVQIVVLEGDPCKIDSYQLRMCISFTDQSDMFARIDSLIGGREYLVNIDGYLGDQCEFDIQFSTTNYGIPIQAKNLKYADLKIKPLDTLVSVQWVIPDSLVFKLSEVSLYRKHEKDKAAERVFVSSMSRNAYGQTETMYSVLDTLKKRGHVQYSVYGKTVDGHVLLLAREEFLYRHKDKPGAKNKYMANVVFVTPSDGHVNIVVYEEITRRKLFSTTRRAEKGKNVVPLDVSEYVNDGIKLFTIEVSNKNFKQEHHLRLRK